MSIYISIASYEDPGLIDTVKSAYLNASDPSGIIFGICLQYENDPDLNFIPKKQKRVLIYDPKVRPGVNRVRHILKSMIIDEEYFLQIDSHTRFDKDWDLYLINSFKELKLENNNFVISAHLSDRFYTKPTAFKFKVSPITEDFFNLDAKEVEGNDLKYYKSYYVKSGLIFTDKETINKIEYDKNTHSIQEESYLSFYLYMNSYSIYFINGYCPVIHNNHEYNNFLYGTKNPVQKNWGAYVDGWEDIKEINFTYIYNEPSRFSINGSLKKPFDFWKDIGLEPEYFKIKDKFDKILRKTK